MISRTVAGLLMLWAGAVLAAPIRLTFVETANPTGLCMKQMSPAAIVLTVALLTPPAACAIVYPGKNRCFIIAALDGPATMLAYLALTTPDGVIGHEWRHCLDNGHNFHEAPTWQSGY